MANDFGEALRQFVFSVDIVNETTYQRVKEIIEEYLKKLNIAKFRFLVSYRVNDGPGLKTEWVMNGDDWARNIKTDAGEYVGQNSFSYDIRTPLWVVGAQKEALRTASQYIDLWSGREDIPPSMTVDGIHTSIFIPIIHDDKATGIVNFESKEYWLYTEAQKERFSVIAEVIGNLYQLHCAYQIQSNSTKAALKNLKAPENVTSLNVKPRVFLASSKRSSEDVIQSIKKLLTGKYKDKLTLVYWADFAKSGSVSKELANEILACDYAICYLSEKSPNEPEITDRSPLPLLLGLAIYSESIFSSGRNVSKIRIRR